MTNGLGKCVAIVLRDDAILMEKTVLDGRTFYTLPGGNIEPGETPEQAVVRELKEECNIDVEVIRPINVTYRTGRSVKYSFECKITDGKEPTVGFDPELSPDEQIIKDVLFMKLSELNEKDRAFLWSEGLMETGGFADEVMKWGDEISYPGSK